MNATGEPSQWTVLAHLLRPQGRKGELLAELLTDFPERFAGNARVFLARPGFTGPAEDARAVTVTGHWLPVGRNQGRIVLAFARIDSIERAEELASLDLMIPTEERVELEEDSEYISDLIDCIVYDGDAAVGRVAGVEFPATPDGNRRLQDAAPLLTVLTDTGEEVLIPYVQSFLISLDPENKRIVMKLPQGLVELNRSGAPDA